MDPIAQTILASAIGAFSIAAIAISVGFCTLAQAVRDYLRQRAENGGLVARAQARKMTQDCRRSFLQPDDVHVGSN